MHGDDRPSGWVTLNERPWYLNVVGLLALLLGTGLILLIGIVIYAMLIVGW